MIKEIKAHLTKPYTEKEKLGFIVENNHNKGYTIKELENGSLQAFEMVKTDEEKAEVRKQEFYKNFIATSLGNYRLEPKGYANAQQAMDVTNTMATALGGLTEQLTSLVIFYETPDFTKEKECTEEWLVAHQVKPDVMTLKEWQKFYLEFCQLYAMQQYKTDITNQDDSL